MRWGSRRRRQRLAGDLRTYDDTIFGAAGRGDIQALENIKIYRGIQNFPPTLYMAAFAGFRPTVIDWLARNGVDFWCLTNARQYWGYLGNELLDALCARENKYLFILGAEKTSGLRKLPEDVVRYLLEYI